MDAVVRRSREVIEKHTPLAMAFYTSGQLFAEEYYTQAVIARGRIGTPHLDGNTRLCTATAEWALIETFGSDGDPGSYTDIDACDTLFLVGHNVAETQTVLWMRMLDRLHGADRLRLVVIDPRVTADVFPGLTGPGHIHVVGRSPRAGSSAALSQSDPPSARSVRPSLPSSLRASGGVPGSGPEAGMAPLASPGLPVLGGGPAPDAVHEVMLERVFQARPAHRAFGADRFGLRDLRQGASGR
jgi:hypothetical protein